MHVIKKIPLHVITAVSRPENLERIGRDLQVLIPFFNVTWFRVWHEQHKLQSCVPTDILTKNLSAPNGYGGWEKKNFGLQWSEVRSRCTDTGSAWVYVLDDDNTIGMDFATTLIQYIVDKPAYRAFVFGQRSMSPKIAVRIENFEGQIDFPLGRVDQGMYVVHHDICCGLRYSIEEVDKTTADGKYFTELTRKASPWIWASSEVVTYYNALR